MNAAIAEHETATLIIILAIGMIATDSALLLLTSR
jgi:hypothetical protein